MNINNIAFLIPIHPPYYHYIYSLINNLNLSNISIDIFLVFSSQSDFDLFEFKNKINPIIVNGPLNSNSYVTFKKFYGLKHLIESSDFKSSKVETVYRLFENTNSLSAPTHVVL